MSKRPHFAALAAVVLCAAGIIFLDGIDVFDPAVFKKKAQLLMNL